MAKAWFALALSSSILVAGCCKPPSTVKLAVPLRPQQTSMWCWAASGQMTMNFVHPASNVTQPDEANKRFGRTDCGNNPTPAACINGGWPEYAKYNFSFVRTADTALTWSQLRKEVGCAKRPFAFSWHWPGGGGHMMVAFGYASPGGVNHVWVNDPWAPNVGNQVLMLYGRYVGGPGWGHTHWDDFYQIRYTGS